MEKSLVLLEAYLRLKSGGERGVESVLLWDYTEHSLLKAIEGGCYLYGLVI